MGEENDNERNITNNELANDNEEGSISGSSFFEPSPDENCCKGGTDSAIGGGLRIDSRLSSDAANEDDNGNSTSGIGGLNENDEKLLIEVEAEDVCVGSPRVKKLHCGLSTGRYEFMVFV
jgi:hypothetical protein